MFGNCDHRLSLPLSPNNHASSLLSIGLSWSNHSTCISRYTLKLATIDGTNDESILLIKTNNNNSLVVTTTQSPGTSVPFADTCRKVVEVSNAVTVQPLFQPLVIRSCCLSSSITRCLPLWRQWCRQV